jgi:hypothetical protein
MNRCIYTAYTPLKRGVNESAEILKQDVNGSVPRHSRRTALYFVPQWFQSVSEFLQP